MLPILKYNGSVIAKRTEFARTIFRKTLGLMFRKDIPTDYAMIFVFEKPLSVGIHMLFMRFPIDVLFLNEEKKIAGLFRLNPWTGYKAMKGIRYVIEMNEGSIEKHRLAIGGQMEFEDLR